MARPVLEIQGLKASVEEALILKGIDLTIRGGEIHAIMGPNGAGKSTLSSVLMGHPAFTVHEGVASLDGEDLLIMEVDERARKGLFMAMQYPAEIAGVTNADFLRTAMNARRDDDDPVNVFDFRTGLRTAVEELEMNPDLPERYLNEGFSGGEKKRNEILQMKLLNPRIAILDEIDSGLDIDALRIVGENIKSMVDTRGEEVGVLMITHYQRLLNYVTPDYVHVLMDGRIVKSGDAQLALRLEEEGYEWLREELGLAAPTAE